jgi:type IX secretion system PorP/SprF family membrane protein
MRKIYLFILFISCAYVLQAQDPHFSQFTSSGMNLNPSLTGVMEGQYRVQLAYRDQWSSLGPSYKTMAAGVDFRYHIVSDDFASFGIKLLRDQAGAGAYSQTYGHLSGGYMKKLFGGRNTAKQFIAGGVQAGVGQHGVNWDQLWFGNQYDASILSENLELDNGEPDILIGSGTSEIFVDLGAGLSYIAIFDDRKNVYAGVAMHHINEPVISLFNDSSVKLASRLSIHGGGEWLLNESLSLQPAFQVQLQQSHKLYQLGSRVRYNSFDNREIGLRVGAWLRMVSDINTSLSAEAIIASAMLEYSDYQFGFSYDITLSDLNIANNRQGAFEFTLSYLFPITQRIYKIESPRL